MSNSTVVSQQMKAQQLLVSLSRAFEEKMSEEKRGDARFFQSVLKSGTLHDKLAALALRIQESPLFRLSTLDSLLNSAAKKNRRESELAVLTLKDLFLSSLLPDRKLW